MGLLREPVSALQRADIVLVTRCDAVNSETLNSIHKRIQKYCSHICNCSHQPVHLKQLDDNSIHPLSTVHQKLRAYFRHWKPPRVRTYCPT